MPIQQRKLSDPTTKCFLERGIISFGVVQHSRIYQELRYHHFWVDYSQTFRRLSMFLNIMHCLVFIYQLTTYKMDKQKKNNIWCVYPLHLKEHQFPQVHLHLARLHLDVWQDWHASEKDTYSDCFLVAFDRRWTVVASLLPVLTPLMLHHCGTTRLRHPIRLNRTLSAWPSHFTVAIGRCPMASSAQTWPGTSLQSGKDQSEVAFMED